MDICFLRKVVAYPSFNHNFFCASIIKYLMNFKLLFSFVLVFILYLISPRLIAQSKNNPDVLTIPADLVNPAIVAGNPKPGITVLETLPNYSGTEVAYSLYLPVDWIPGKLFPVMVEYLGNTAQVRDNKGIGYGLSGGKGFIWVVLPFINNEHTKDVDWWWGDVAATIAYAKEVVPSVCRQWGGDKSKVILTGYSRGAIACNYIGLHDDAIAKLWKAIVPISHYDDGHTLWGMTKEEQNLAPERLRRLGKTPQLICGEYSTFPQIGSDKPILQMLKEKNIITFEEAKKELGLMPITALEGTRNFIKTIYPSANQTMIDFPWVNHGSQVLLRPTPERKIIQEWIQKIL